MPKACEEMGISGRNVLMAVQRLQAVPGHKASRDNMVMAAKKLLQTTMKVGVHTSYWWYRDYRQSRVIRLAQG